MAVPAPRGIELKRCKHGRGVFAAKNFGAGGVIGVLRDAVIRSARKAPMCSLKISRFRNVWLGHALEEGHQWDCFLDHSDRPNAKLVIGSFASLKEVPLVAVSGIRKGQEILIDYRSYGDRLYKDRRF